MRILTWRRCNVGRKIVSICNANVYCIAFHRGQFVTSIKLLGRKMSCRMVYDVFRPPKTCIKWWKFMFRRTFSTWRCIKFSLSEDNNNIFCCFLRASVFLSLEMFSERSWKFSCKSRVLEGNQDQLDYRVEVRRAWKGASETDENLTPWRSLCQNHQGAPWGVLVKKTRNAAFKNCLRNFMDSLRWLWQPGENINTAMRRIWEGISRL